MKAKRCAVVFVLLFILCFSLFRLRPPSVAVFDTGVPQGASRGVPEGVPQNAAESINAFAFDLYNELAKDKTDNIFFSPQSVSSALALLYAGASGDTERELRAALHYGDSIHEDVHALQEILNQTPSDVAVIETANAIWLASHLKPKSSYAQLIGKYYGSQITKLDYTRNPQRAEKTINDWSHKKTQGRIPQVVAGLPKSTQAVLTSAIYFHSAWAEEFPKELTQKATFHNPYSPEKRIDLMFNGKKFLYAENETFQALLMHYKQQKYSMFILLPKDPQSLALFETPISFAVFKDMYGSLARRHVFVHFPKFKVETEYEMTDALNAMGIKLAFTDDAQFTKLADESIKIDRMIHKTFIKVDEKTTEAAAAIAVSAKLTAPTSLATFRADHPFIYFILENKTNAILFMGRFTG